MPAEPDPIRGSVLRSNRGTFLGVDFKPSSQLKQGLILGGAATLDLVEITYSPQTTRGYRLMADDTTPNPEAPPSGSPTPGPSVTPGDGDPEPEGSERPADDPEPEELPPSEEPVDPDASPVIFPSFEPIVELPTPIPLTRGGQSLIRKYPAGKVGLVAALTEGNHAFVLEMNDPDVFRFFELNREMRSIHVTIRFFGPNGKPLLDTVGKPFAFLRVLNVN